jgi:hypothetical protein
LEAAVIIHLLLDLRGLFGRDALAEFLPVEKALEDEVRAAPARLPGRGFKELLAQGAAAEVVNGLQVLQEDGSFLAEGIEKFWHARNCIYTHTISNQKSSLAQGLSIWVT